MERDKHALKSKLVEGWVHALDQCNGLLDTEHNEVDVAALFPEISFSSEASLRLNARREIGSAAVLLLLFIITCSAVPAIASHQDFTLYREQKKNRDPCETSFQILFFSVSIY